MWTVDLNLHHICNLQIHNVCGKATGNFLRNFLSPLQFAPHKSPVNTWKQMFMQYWREFCDRFCLSRIRELTISATSESARDTPQNRSRTVVHTRTSGRCVNSHIAVIICYYTLIQNVSIQNAPALASNTYARYWSGIVIYEYYYRILSI